MTKAQRTRAERILEEHRAGLFRFAVKTPDAEGELVPWPPGFVSQIGPVEKRGGHMSTKAGRRWHGDNIAKMGAQR